MKYRLKTRLLETKEAVRHSVVRAAVRERGARHVVLDSVAVAKFDKAAWSGDPNMIHYAREARDGAETAGTVRTEVVRHWRAGEESVQPVGRDQYRHLPHAGYRRAVGV